MKSEPSTARSQIFRAFQKKTRRAIIIPSRVFLPAQSFFPHGWNGSSCRSEAQEKNATRNNFSQSLFFSPAPKKPRRAIVFCGRTFPMFSLAACLACVPFSASVVDRVSAGAARLFSASFPVLRYTQTSCCLLLPSWLVFDSLLLC